MIIKHLSDWNRFPKAIVHSTTKNTTFLRMADLYKSMGIQNHYFHLALINPALEFVDPFSLELTKEQMLAIGIECGLNPWYYFREVARVPPRAGVNPTPLRANRGNIILYWCFFNHIDVLLVQPRQTGKSLSVDELMIYLLDIATHNTLISLLTKDNPLRQENVERLKAIRALVPKYLTRFDQKRDSDNKEGLSCMMLNNRYRISIGQNNDISANNLGRGMTSPIIHGDEIPFIKYADIVVPALLKAGNAARDEAKLVGAHYGNIFTTTAGKKDTRSGRYMFDLMMGGMICDERILLDSGSEKRAMEIVRTASHGIKPLINITLSHRQLGYTDEWLTEKIRESASTKDDADRDYLNRWTSGGLNSALSTEINEQIKASIVDASYPQIVKQGYVLRWYIPKESINEALESASHVMGIDTSDAIGRDSITMVIVNAETLDLVCAASVNETSVLKFANFVADMLIMFPTITCIPERKSSWVALIETLILRLTEAKIDPFRRIYNIIVDRSETMETEFRQIQRETYQRGQQFYETMKRHFGFNTSGSGEHSRTILYTNVFEQCANLAATKIRDKQLGNELLGLETKNGRIDHSNDSHDDMVIAWLLCGWLLMFSKNLDFYGIRSPLRKAHRRNDIVYDVYNEYNDSMQDQLIETINDLVEKLKAEKNDLFFQRLEAQIRSIEKQLDTEHLESISVDGIIKEVKEERRKNLRRNADLRDFDNSDSRRFHSPLDRRNNRMFNKPDSWA